MRVALRTWIIAPLLAVALAAGGCGDDRVTAQNTYVDATNHAVRRFEDRFMALQADITSTATAAQSLTTLRALQAATDRTVADLRAVHAPSDVAELHAQLIQQVGEYAAVVRTAERDFRTTDTRRILAARARFSSSLTAVTKKITATIAQINDRLK